MHITYMLKIRENTLCLTLNASVLRDGLAYVTKRQTECQYSSKEHLISKTGNVLINVTLRRVRASIFAMEKQEVQNILSACLQP
jgi:hypothetical protein